MPTIADAANWGVFRTTRNQVRFDMGPDLHERFPTRGEQQTFYNVCRVPWTQKDAFLADILPDVSTTDPDHASGSFQLLKCGSYDLNNYNFTRRFLNRKIPQRHPIHTKAWVVDAVVLRGEGTFRYDPNAEYLRFTDGVDATKAARDGFALIGVTWQTLPYTVSLVDKSIDSRPWPDEDGTNDVVNAETGNELMRYCSVRITNKAQNLQVKGRNFYYLEDSGAIIRTDPNNANSAPLPVPDTAMALYAGSVLFSITLHMIPAIPAAAWTLINHVNQTSYQDAARTIPSILLPTELFSDVPDVGTVLCLGPSDISLPYFTFSDVKVHDLSLGFLYRPGGDPNVFRGHNALWCGPKNGYRRVVAAERNGINLVRPAPLPQMNGTDTQRLVPVDATDGRRFNPHEYGELSNCFRLTGNKA